MSISLRCCLPIFVIVVSSCGQENPSTPKHADASSPGFTISEAIQAREDYQTTLEALAASRNSLNRQHQAALASGDTEEQAKILETARSTVFEAIVTEIFPAWTGTPWDFNGVSQTPGEGKIACGYFVTTTLRDAGFNLPRTKLAQQASQTIINSLTGRESISISAGKPISEIENHIRRSGVGLYIVGLDSHVGFVVYDGSTLTFVHSSYFTPPRAVVAEPINSDNPLKRSNYRVVGKILDDTLIRKWLRNEAITVGERNA